MKPEVGMYVRTRLGIGKIINVSECNVAVEFSKTNTLVLPISPINIKKASFDITDLIEIGDVIAIKESIDKFEQIFILGLYELELIKEIKAKIKSSKLILESIVTKEQFESMKYRIGGN